MLDSEEFIKEASATGIGKGHFRIFCGENDFVKEYIDLSLASYANTITCCVENKKTGLKTEEIINVEEFFFILFKPEDLYALLKRTFINYRFMNRDFNEEEKEKLTVAFTKAKNNAGNLSEWLKADADIRNPEAYKPEKMLRFSDALAYIKQYCREVSEQDGKRTIYRNTALKEGEKKTLLVRVFGDDPFKADIFIGYYFAGYVNISDYTIDLPQDFYKYCFFGKKAVSSTEDIEEVLRKMPGVSIMDIRYNKTAQDIYVEVSAQRIRVSEEADLCVLQDSSDDNKVKIWVAPQKDGKHLLTLPWLYFHSHNIDNLITDLKKEFSELSEQSDDDIRKKLLESEEIRKAYEVADEKILQNLNREQIEKARELAQALLKVDAYYDYYDKMTGRNNYDKIKGSATTYNFIKKNEGFSVREAVEQYFKTREIYKSMTGQYGAALTFGLSGMGAGAFHHEKTIVMIEDDDISVMENESEDFLEKCRQNGLLIIGYKDGYLHDFVNGDNYTINRNSYTELDHDATTVLEMNLEKASNPDEENKKNG
ncbi:MAG: hypothetical protein IJG49_06785 [Erysipelotrichaceae bacterium]|nr:hypothetical protein [Erysipelotrichaceae bacterium]